MKGVIVYSSKTGNTKRMAEFIYSQMKLKNIDIDIYDINDLVDIERYDFALIGGYVDRAYPDKKAKKLIESTKQNNLGIFVTMGAMPDSEHGEKVSENLEKLLKNRNSLGFYKCPGLVDQKLIEGLKGLKAIIVPRKVKDKMIEASINSRYATDDELMQSFNYFYKRIRDLIAD